jgi:bifunctional UDP-N-acetylglucosamine pyrophosphorylase/glucosamine-1-phosphate N-acetyltransferase
MLQGVTMLDPERTYIDATVVLGKDVTLFPGTVLQGHTVVEEGAEIGPDTRLVDCTVRANAVVEQTVGRLAEIGEGATVGPFASLGPGSRVAPGAVTGPFFAGESEE